MGAGLRLVAVAALGLAAVSAQAAEYPAAAVHGIATACVARKDVPADKSSAFCGCYVARLQQAVAWTDLSRADAAFAAAGESGLDPADRAVLAKAVAAATSCYAATVR